MDPIKISINVNVELSEATRNFISGLFGKVIEAAPAVETTTKKIAPTTTTSTAGTTTATTKAAAASTTTTTTAAAVAEEESEYSITDVRSFMAQKLNDHRSEIKKKLTALGTDSVTNLEKAHYAEFIEYLQSLS